MLRRLYCGLARLLVVATTLVAAGAAASTPEAPPAATPGKTRVVVIPVREQVDSPLLYIIRRGLKEAEKDGAQLVVLDMKTPGGALDATFSIMEALGKYSGRTVTFINSEALSAGAFISATTDEIWFAPNGLIGAAAPVLATGGEIDTTMRQKVVSYLKARVRATTEGRGTYRGQVISAMIDADYELKIGEKVLKPKGELLSLTASEATQTYGEPPQPLLAAGVAKSVDDLLRQKFGTQAFEVTTLEITWSEHLAVFLRGLAPILLGIGILALYIEFKTPGFGVFGITGIVCLAIVFLSNFVAGLSGHEPMLVFGLGLLLVAIELFFVPGVLVLALSGVLLMFGALVWSMADIWPNQPIPWNEDLFTRPLIDLGLGMLVAVFLAVVLARFIPKSWFWDRLVLRTAVSAQAQTAGSAPEFVEAAPSLVGRRGVAVTALFPSGQVEIDGRRYEARLAVGFADSGAAVVVTGRTEFGLTVEVVT